MEEFHIPYEKLVNAKRVGIQLPDGLKRKAIEIAEDLERRGYEVVISGETNFGACDFDLALLEVVDVLLHFAHTPILRDERIVYVPYFVDYDPKIDLKIRERKIALIATAQYVHKIEDVAEWLRKRGFEVEVGKAGGRVVYDGQVLGCNYSVLRGTKAEAVVFIGDGLFHAIGAAIYSGKKVYAYNPLSGELQEVNAGDFEKRRYLEVSKCVGKGRVGILVSSKPGQKRMKLAERLKRLAAQKGLTCHIIYLNNLRAEELYNLPYDFYVNTACPRIAYDDSARFEKPLITPLEFEFLLGLRESIGMDEIEF
jgi:2-(3-amino-3-carboxypropyl)histidine synthase